MFPTVTSLILQALLHFTTFVQTWCVRFVTLSAASEGREKVEPVLGKTGPRFLLRGSNKPAGGQSQEEVAGSLKETGWNSLPDCL